MKTDEAYKAALAAAAARTAAYKVADAAYKAAAAAYTAAYKAADDAYKAAAAAYNAARAAADGAGRVRPRLLSFAAPAPMAGVNREILK